MTDKLKFKMVTVREYILTDEQKHRRAHCLTIKSFNQKNRCSCGLCDEINGEF